MYLERVLRRSLMTVPLSSWRHGRTVTVTRSVSLVELLIDAVPTVPTFAECSRTAGVMESPPAACAVALEPRTPAQATTTGTAKRRVFTENIGNPPVRL